MYRLGPISDSVMLLRKALEINNKEPISYYAMGTNLVAMNNITGAVEFFRLGYEMRFENFERTDDLNSEFLS